MSNHLQTMAVSSDDTESVNESAYRTYQGCRFPLQVGGPGEPPWVLIQGGKYTDEWDNPLSLPNMPVLNIGDKVRFVDDSSTIFAVKEVSVIDITWDLFKPVILSGGCFVSVQEMVSVAGGEMTKFGDFKLRRQASSQSIEKMIANATAAALSKLRKTLSDPNAVD